MLMLTELFDLDLEVSREEALGQIGKYLVEASGGDFIYANLGSEVTEMILDGSHYKKRGYETFVPILIRTYAMEVWNNQQVREAFEKKSQATLGKGLLEVKTGLERRAEHKKFIYTLFGLDTAWLKVAGGLAFDTGMKVLKVAIATFLPGIGLVADAGLGIAQGLWKRMVKKDTAASVLGGLVEAGSHWNEMLEDEQRFFSYRLELERGLQSGTALESLRRLFDPGSPDITDLASRVNEQVEKKIWVTWQNTPEAKVLVDEMGQFDQRLSEVEERLSVLERDVAEVKQVVAQQRLEGSVELTPSNLPVKLGVRAEDVVGLGSGAADEMVLETVNEIIRKAHSAPVIISGEPGAGKTTMLYLISKRLLQGSTKVRLIENIKEFRLTREYSESHPGEYLVFQATDVSQTKEFLEKVNPYLDARGELPRVFAAAGAHHLEDSLLAMEPSSRQRFENIRHRLAYSPGVLGGIVDKLAGNYRFPPDSWPDIRKKILERCEGSPFYISQSLAFLESKGFAEEALESLPQGVRSMVVKILYDQSDNDSRQLVAYHVISRYNHLPERLVRAMKGKSGLDFSGNEKFYTKIGDEVRMHRWYRDVFQEIVAEMKEGKDDPLADRFKEGIEDSKELYLGLGGATGENETAQKDWRDAEVEDKLEAIVWGLLIRVFKAQLDIDPYVGVAKSVKGDKESLYAALLGFALNELFADVTYPEKTPRKLIWIAALYLPKLVSSPLANKLGKADLGEGGPTVIQWLVSLKDENASIVDRKCLRLVAWALVSLDYVRVEREDHAFKGALFDLLQMHDHAKTEYDRDIQVDPADPVSHSNKGAALYESDHSVEALAEIEKAINLDGDDPEYHSNKGTVLSTLGRLEEALAEYDRAIQKNPNEPRYHNFKGHALYESDRDEEALAEFEKAIQLDPSKSGSHTNKGNALDALGRREEALAEYDESIRIDPSDPVCHSNKGSVLSDLGRFKEALVELEKAIWLEPKKPGFHNFRGDALYESDRIEEALAEYEEAIQLDPSRPVPYNNRGRALDTLGRYEEAVAEYDRAIQLDPDLPVYHSNKGDALNELSRHEEALAEFDKAVKLDADEPDYHNSKGDALYETHRDEEALAEYARAIQLDPAVPVYHSSKGVILYELGRHEEALAEFDKAIQLDPDTPKYRELRGGVLDALGRREEALTEFEKAKRMSLN